MAATISSLSNGWSGAVVPANLPSTHTHEADDDVVDVDDDNDDTFNDNDDIDNDNAFDDDDNDGWGAFNEDDDVDLGDGPSVMAMLQSINTDEQLQRDRKRLEVNQHRAQMIEDKRIADLIENQRIIHQERLRAAAEKAKVDAEKEADVCLFAIVIVLLSSSSSPSCVSHQHSSWLPPPPHLI
jgi:hypothetical protein